METSYLNGIPNSITQETKNGGGINRNYYGEDGVQVKQISNDSHGEKIEYGDNGEHAHDYEYSEDGELKSRKKRNLTDEEREENGDIL